MCTNDIYCANCGIRITWSAILSSDKAYCCIGCALGGPCYCSYDYGGKTGPMKMIMSIVQDEDAEPLLDDLTSVGYRATKIASTGGFLRLGNSVLLVGVEADLVNDVIDAIRRRCRTRQWPLRPTAVPIPNQTPPLSSIEVTVGGATVFVWDVERYERL